MFIRLVGEKCNILFECDRVIEQEDALRFFKGDDIFIELLYENEENISAYVMNNDGKTIDSFHIHKEKELAEG